MIILTRRSTLQARGPPPGFGSTSRVARPAATDATYRHDGSYSQKLSSAMVWFDGIAKSAGGGRISGVSVGYVGSDADFDTQRTSAALSGIVFNGYFSVVNGGTFLAATVGGNSLAGWFEAPLLTGYSRQKVDLASVGGSIEAGLRRPLFRGSAIEPSICSRMSVARSTRSPRPARPSGSTVQRACGPVSPCGCPAT